MERETVKKFDLEAAFKALDEIVIPDVSGQGRFTPNRVNLRERLSAKHAHEVLVEDYFDVSMDEDLNEAQQQRDAEIAKAKLARIEKIVDLDAESEEDILPSYVGKIIVQCPQCMTLFYKNEEDIEKSEETPDVVNINEICQHCGNSSGYTLVGKVGGVDESEAENFDMDDMAAEGEEDELNLDFPEEGTEEIDAEGTGEAGEAMEDEDLSLDLEEEPEEEAEEEPEEETNESLHNSTLLDKIEDKNDLKTDIESEHLTLMEELTEEQMAELDEGMEHWYHTKFDKPYSIKAQQQLEDELNGECGEISDARRKEIEQIFAWQRDWERRHSASEEAAVEVPAEEPVEEPVAVESLNDSELLDEIEAENDLKTDAESEHLTLNEETIDELDSENDEMLDEVCCTKEAVEFEEFDDVFDDQVTEYLGEVYSNVEKYESTNCNAKDKTLVIEGKITFKSGKSKATKFVFENVKQLNNKIVFRGINEGLTGTTKAFRMTCRADGSKLISESLRYSYKINESLVRGTTK